MIEENVQNLLRELQSGNSLGEKVVLVAATKTRTAQEIQRAIDAGVSCVGENRVQEFTRKYDLIRGAERHFIGHLQLNKIKYLIGKTDLIHSVDRDGLAFELSRLSQRAGTLQNVLIEVNVGREESKSGYDPDDALSALARVRALPALRPVGFMAMLPESDDRRLLRRLADEMRVLYDQARREDGNIGVLSMGMSGDWRLCVERGSNMVRLGTAIFGQR